MCKQILVVSHKMTIVLTCYLLFWGCTKVPQWVERQVALKGYRNRFSLGCCAARKLHTLLTGGLVCCGSAMGWVRWKQLSWGIARPVLGVFQIFSCYCKCTHECGTVLTPILRLQLRIKLLFKTCCSFYNLNYDNFSPQILERWVHSVMYFRLLHSAVHKERGMAFRPSALHCREVSSFQ